MRRTKQETRGAGDEAGLAAEATAPRRGGARVGDSSKRYSALQKRGLVDEFERSGGPSTRSARVTG